MNGISAVAHRRRLWRGLKGEPNRVPAGASSVGLELARAIVQPANGALGDALVGIVAGLQVVPADEPRSPADG